jgi:regulator of extracellular matrix RemA (YlzA/DUF370 family)
MDSDHVILSAIQNETVSARMSGMADDTAEEVAND